jgi:hypothetical protein
VKKLRRSGFVKRPFPLGQTGSDRKGGAIQLVDEEAIAAWEAFGECSNFVGEVDGLLIDLELLEHEGHGGLG